MDMFTDKLAQKLTAQEIIRANSAADTEELHRLRNQIAEYNECLLRLQQLIDEGTERLQAVHAGSTEIDGLVGESIERIGTSLRQDVSELTGRLTDLDKRLGEHFDSMDRSVEERLATSNKPIFDALTGLENSLHEKLQQFDDTLEEKTDGQLSERLSEMDEKIHRECVKVYRNVQAVILAESEKQKEAISETAAGSAMMGKKVSAVLKVSVAALIFSVFGIVLQILGMLNLLPF